MSTQKSIYDAMITALTAVTGVNKVTQDARAWGQADPMSMNVLYLIPKKPENDQQFFRHPSSPDMSARLEIIIDGQVREVYDTATAATLDTLMKNVEIAINNNVALNALVNDIYLESDEFIREDNQGLFSAVYIAEYFYNHASP